MKLTHLFSALLVSVLALSFGRIFARVQTTVIGYDIGRLKVKEGELLEEKSQLRMELANLSTKKSLLNILKQSDSSGDVAVR